MMAAADSDSNVYINMQKVRSNDPNGDPGILTSMPGELYSPIDQLEEGHLKSYYSNDRNYHEGMELAGMSVYMYFVDSHAFKRLTVEEHRLLLCIKTFPHRMELVRNETKFLSIKNLVVGDLVKAFCSHAWQSGRLRYKGAIPQSNEERELNENVSGTWFGVELHGQSAGLGKSDGTVFGIRLFQCDPNCGVFVHAACIRPDDTIPALQEVQPLTNTMPGMDNAVEMFVIPADLLNRYGKRPHDDHIRTAKLIAGVSWVQFNERNNKCLIEGANVDICRHARTQIELMQELYRLPNQHLAKFTDKNYKKINDIRKFSNAIITEDEKNEFYTLFRVVGLASEVRRGMEAFEAEVAKLGTTSQQGTGASTSTPSTSGTQNGGSGSGNAGKKRKNRSNTGSNPGLVGQIQERVENMEVDGQNVEGRLPPDLDLPPIVVGDTKECIICMGEKAVMVFYKCGHKQTCRECAERLFSRPKKECPTCRKPIEDIVRVFE